MTCRGTSGNGSPTGMIRPTTNSVYETIRKDLPQGPFGHCAEAPGTMIPRPSGRQIAPGMRQMRDGMMSDFVARKTGRPRHGVRTGGS